VASIKPFKPAAGGRGGGGIKPKSAGQGYDAVGASVTLMISLMYQMPIQHITGGPGWLDSDLWTVDDQGGPRLQYGRSSHDVSESAGGRV